MSNFKSGSGNLDFGGGDEAEEKSETPSETRETREEDEEALESASAERPTTSQDESSDTDGSDGEQTSHRTPEGGSPAIGSSADGYPYFVRRSNVGDERDTRLEIHVRNKVAEREAKFRNELAEQLGASEVSKTDAREFALLTAFECPERVAELMREEGFGVLD